MTPRIVLTRNYVPTHPMAAVAEEMKLPCRTFCTPAITMNFINVATLCIDNEFAPSSTEDATTLDGKGVVIMIHGDSGIKKSECALALIEHGHSLIANDLTYIRLLDERNLVASSRPFNRGYMECRGIGIINIAEMFGIKSVRMEKPIDLVVSFREWSPDVIEERTGLEGNYYDIVGIKVPNIEFYACPDRNIARLIEVAALVCKRSRKSATISQKTSTTGLIANMMHPQESRHQKHVFEGKQRSFFAVSQYLRKKRRPRTARLTQQKQLGGFRFAC